MALKKHSELSATDQAARVREYRRLRSSGYEAMAAWISSLRHVHFIKDLSASVRAANKRSKAARRARTSHSSPSALTAA